MTPAPFVYEEWTFILFVSMPICIYVGYIMTYSLNILGMQPTLNASL